MAQSYWKVDPAHTDVTFAVKHMMITTVRGRFKDVDATVCIDEENPDRSYVVGSAAAASVDTGAPDRDAHLRSPDFFDAERHPAIRFRSTRVNGAHNREGDRFTVTGDLTIRDSTIPVTFDCVFDGGGQDPWGNDRLGFSVEAEIDRREWGLRWNQAIETGGVLVANKVKIGIEAQLVRKPAQIERPVEQPRETGAPPI